MGSEVYAVRGGRQVVRNYTPGKGNPEALRHWRRENLLALVNMDSTTITVTLTNESSTNPLMLQISRNGVRWENWGVGFDGRSALVAPGKRIYIRGINNATLYGYRLKASGRFGLEGELFRLLHYRNTSLTRLRENAFRGFLQGGNIVLPPSLSSVHLAPSCYRALFYDCALLETAPALPAMQMADYCYYYMFTGCKALKVAPSLPSTSLAPSCYAYMFEGTGLEVAPGLPADILSQECYRHMFAGCEKLTTIDLPAKTLAPRCYENIIRETTEVKSIVLPAPTILDESYKWLCYGSGVSQITCMATQGITARNIYSILNAVSHPGVFYCIAGTEGLYPRANTGIPTSWTIVPIEREA